MIETAQTILTKDEGGNCFAACLASILEVPLSVVPNAAKLWADGDFDGGWNLIQGWLAGIGLYVESFEADVWTPTGYWIGIVPSEFLEGETHAVVFHGDRFVWNPRPGGRAYARDEVTAIDLLVASDPAVLAEALPRLRIQERAA